MSDRIITNKRLLGSFVVALGKWALFGEMALIGDDNVRKAHALAEEDCFLLRINQKLFNATMKKVVEEIYQEKRKFVNESPIFSKWTPDSKEQLMLALEREAYPFNRRITRQDEPANNIYFISR